MADEKTLAALGRARNYNEYMATATGKPVEEVFKCKRCRRLEYANERRRALKQCDKPGCHAQYYWVSRTYPYSYTEERRLNNGK